ncbi:MAG: hypothetical protein OXH38_04735 [Chloroflexi bacterium]|nr:hypothetical protein [Chloroflexota bacterium]
MPDSVGAGAGRLLAQGEKRLTELVLGLVQVRCNVSVRYAVEQAHAACIDAERGERLAGDDKDAEGCEEPF